ncbi:MAG: CPBP family intramembrane metalloprotease [Bacteroidetes bacterium]|nr:CPBP family intramembrane metalloprotease [Bacteroidota bacterium]
MSLFPFTGQELKQLDKKPIVVLLTTTVCLVGIQFLGNINNFSFLVQQIQGTHFQFYSFVYWASVTIFFFAIVPVVVIKFFLNEPLRDYGLKTSQVFGYYKIYALTFAILFPFLFLAAYTYEFQVTYPFFVPPIEEFVPFYLIGELLYVLTFFALEFFFRGFMVLGLKKNLGFYSVFVMTVPYCMIHFAKPLPECIGSIFAGVFLGLMSYKTQSIWMGSLIHSAVALSMNWLSLWHRGYFN